MLLGNRQYILTIGDRVYKNLRLRFEVKSELGGIQHAKLELWGLTNQTASSFTALLPVTLDLMDARGNVSNLFSGGLLNLEQRKQGADLITTVHGWSHASTNMYDKYTLQFEENSPGSYIVERLKEFLSKAGLSLVYGQGVLTSISDIKVKSGATYKGTPLTVLKGICNTLNLTFEVTQKSVYLMTVDTMDTKAQRPAVEVSVEKSNLIGTPSVSGVASYRRTQATAVLNPEIVVGSLVDLKSQYYSLSEANQATQGIRNASGVYKVFGTVHRGDNYDALWEVQMNLRDYAQED